MCGIAGIIQSNTDRFSIHQLKNMTDAMVHRGPDGEGLWQNSSNTVQLGHRRLAIIDLTRAAAQPMHFTTASKGEADGPCLYTIIHNGEIYNYIELRQELEKKGYRFHTHSDTEVILAAYDFWDDECIDHFDGMFSFAIWDEQEQELFAARDRFGEKPFFYFHANGEFVFASEMKALWAAGIERRLNLKMLFNYITIGYVDNPERPEETFYENICKLPPASRLFYKPSTGELTIEKYWVLDKTPRNKNITDQDAAERFGELFHASVRKRMRSDVPLGINLSGGLDSSSIANTVASLPEFDSRLQTFTAGFPGFERDEVSYAGVIANRYNLASHVTAVTDENMLEDWESFIYYQEEPVASASAFAQYKIFELARQHQVTVLLDGQGADEVLAGYHRYYKWYWQELFRKRKLIRSAEIAAARKLGVKEKFDFNNVLAALLPELASVILEHQYLAYALQHKDLTRDFIRKQSKEAYYTKPAISTLNGLLHFNTCVHGLEELLRYADRNSMAHSREVRLPFLNHELVEFVFSLPSHFKIRKGWTKWILRQVMKEKLPQEIVWRKDKVGFEPPQKNWMQNPALQERIMEARKKLVREKILKPKVLERNVESSGAYEPNAYDWRYLLSAAYL